MDQLQWNDMYSVEIPSIDEQHKSLLKMINDLSSSLSQKGNLKAQLLVLLKLTSYTISHFRHEEKLFDTYHYEEVEEHKTAHQKLIERVEEFQDRLAEKNEDVGGELLAFLVDWLLNHILIMDKKYTPFMKKHGIT